MKPFLVYENGRSFTKEEFDQEAKVYSTQLIEAGYNRTCRLGVYDHFENLPKIKGIMDVCSVVIIDHELRDFELSWYDIDIWTDSVPVPRFNQCEPNEIIGFCSSGSTELPRIIPWTKEQQVKSGLDFYLKNLWNINSNDITFNCIPPWPAIGIQLLLICYETGATYHVLENPFRDWPKINPTFVIGNTAIYKRLMKDAIPFEKYTIRNLCTIGSPLHKDFKQKIQKFFNCISTDTYGINEIGTVSIMHIPQKFGSVGFPVEGKSVSINEESEIIVDGFYTGDLGYFDKDGFLFITGRKKDVINKEGRKIMPYEVEKALLDCGADDCVVFGHDRVFALVVGEYDKLKLSQKLLHYKIPDKVFYVDKLPKKGIGKISRKEILEMYRNKQ